tara:strand:+ start:2326 stop:2556 length:231 start_codon:yes stop_codon:yes gene_type:complete
MFTNGSLYTRMNKHNKHEGVIPFFKGFIIESLFSNPDNYQLKDKYGRIVFKILRLSYHSCIPLSILIGLAAYLYFD